MHESFDFAFLRPVSVGGRVRVGPNRDAGYVLVDEIAAQADVLLSYGVGFDTDFELDFLNRYRARILMFDPTMFPESWMRYLLTPRKPRSLYRALRRWRYCRRWVKDREALGLFVIDEGIASTSYDRYSTLADHFKRYDLTGRNVFLKIDIEENEYEVLLDGLASELRSVSQIVVEFHALSQRWSDLQVILRTTLANFRIVHVHGNNYGPLFAAGVQMVPEVIELTLVREDLLGTIEASNEIFPVSGLDFPNRPGLPDFDLGFVTTS